MSIYDLSPISLIVTATLVLAYDDNDYKCPGGQERLAGITSTFKSGYRTHEFICANFQGSPNNVDCSLGKPLKCDGPGEGCPKGQFVGGLQTLEVVANGPKLMIPYCCKADNLAIASCTNPETTNFKGESFSFNVKDNEVLNIDSCWLINDRNGKLHDTLLKISTCTYSVE